MHNSLFIGIGVDKFSEPSIEPLRFCSSDLRFIYRLFYVFNICNKCYYLINKQATLSNISKILNHFKYLEGNVVIFYSSHGRNIGNKSRLLCYDTDPLAMNETSLSTDDIIDILAKYKSKNIKLFLDACDISINKSITSKNLKIYYPNKAATHEDTILNHSVFVNNLLHNYSCVSRYNQINNTLGKRHQRLRQKIANCFIRNNNLLYLTGESGIGKSHFLRDIIKNEENTYYISIPNRENISLNIILNLVTQEITKQKNTNFDIDPERYLLFFDSLHPYSLFILDHTEHLTDQVNLALIAFLKKFKSQIIISTRKIPKDLSSSQIVIMPNLNKTEIKEILNELNISNYINVDGLLECSNYLQLLEKIHSITDEAISNKNVIEAIISTGGYANQRLFCKNFKISNKEIRRLKNAGVLVKHDDLYFPHDSLYEKVSVANITKLSDQACFYWKEECKSNSIRSIYQYILVLNYFNPYFDIKDEILFINIINKLSGRNNMHVLSSLYDYLIKHDFTPALAKKMAESLIDIGKYEMAKNIVIKCNYNCPSLNSLSAECLWWEGDFEQAIISANHYLSKNNTDNNKFSLMCSRGIALFFLGNWQSAKTDLSTIVAHKEHASNKCLFMSYCVLATIDGIRGTCFPSCIKNFISAIDIAKQAKKHSWLAIAFGNIGEIFWKAGDADFAIKILNIADELSYLNGNDALNLEIKRNLLHSYHCANKFNQIKEELFKLQKIYDETSETYVKMQLINTLITHYILSGTNGFKKLISKAYQLTENSMEYKIYTYSNVALSYLNDKKLIKAINKMNEALTLCKKGSNWLAMKQILRDWDELTSKSTNDRFPTSKQVFQKWYQILETKLSRHLHHLLRLREYLEQSYTSS